MLGALLSSNVIANKQGVGYMSAIIINAIVECLENMEELGVTTIIQA